MSDDDIEEPRESGTPRPKRKKRRPVAAAALQPVAPVAPAASGFTGGHLAAALVAGLVIGGMGGWAFRGSGTPTTTSGVAKDSATAVAQQPSGARPATERPQQPPQPTGPVYIALADYSPREGPQHAKVTILEFSDFQ